MAGKPRSETMNPSIEGVFHCSSRCVRGLFLCGDDKRSRKNYDYRRDWIEERVEKLARLFAIEVCFFAIMQNHFHLVLKNLPQLVARWSDKQVLKRSIQIYPRKFQEMGVVDGKATRQQLKNFARDAELMEELRLRLSDPSWFLRQLKQYVAKRSNREDGVSGHFFEGRFNSREVTDEAGLLICGVYVDLNQIRAGEADSVGASTRTSAYRRLQGLASRRNRRKDAASRDGFLSPINTRGGDGQTDYARAGTEGGLRASDKGLFEMTLEQYLEFLDWTGRQLRRDKRGKISDKAPPVLEQLGLDGGSFVTMIEQFEDFFHTAVGTAESLAQVAADRGQRWLRGAKKVAEAEAQNG